MSLEDREYPISFACPARNGTLTTSLNPRRHDNGSSIEPKCSNCRPPREPAGFTAEITTDLQTTNTPEQVGVAIIGYCFHTAPDGEKVRIATNLLPSTPSPSV